MTEGARQAWEIAGSMAVAWTLALGFGRLPSRGYPFWIKRHEQSGVYWTVMVIFAAACLAVVCMGLRA